MDEEAEFWQALKERSKQKFDADRANFLAQALIDDDGGWTKHTQWHWSRTVEGQRLDYWPSRKKFQYKGTVYRGLRLMRTILKGESK
jgi:hypothetical protein